MQHRRFFVLLSDPLCPPILPQSETVSGLGMSCCGFGCSQGRENRSCCFYFHRKNITRRLQVTTRSMRHWGTMPGGQIFRLKAISSSQLITNTQTMGSCHLSFSSDSKIFIWAVKGTCAFSIYGYGHRSPEEMQALGRAEFLGWDSHRTGSPHPGLLLVESSSTFCGQITYLARTYFVLCQTWLLSTLPIFPDLCQLPMPLLCR